MSRSQCMLRVLTSWLLVGAISGVVPALAAQQPGTLATPASSASTAALSSPFHDLSHLVALPRIAQEPSTQGSSGASIASANTHHIPKWAWVVIVAAAGAGIGVGVVEGNKQGGKTAAATTTVTIGAGSGVTAGAP